MSLDDLLAAVNQSQVNARNATSLRDYARARAELVPSIAELEQFLDSGEDTDGGARSQAARYLSDVYGMLGGIERRDGRLAAALAAYQLGRAVEQDPRFRIVNSYNLVNAIVLEILLNPASFGERSAELSDAEGRVQAQARGPRKVQWWAWADYGLLALLAGEEDDAIEAYAKFSTRGPARSDYESVTDVLVLLSTALRDVAADRARLIDETLTDLEDLKAAL